MPWIDVSCEWTERDERKYVFLQINEKTILEETWFGLFGLNLPCISNTYALICFTNFAEHLIIFVLIITQEDVKFSIDMMNAKLTDEDKIQCNKVIKSYLDGKVADPVSEGKTM